jgi:hypothetical protein
MKQLLLSDREATALTRALELYIRVGLGQLSEVGKELADLVKERTEVSFEVKHHLAEAERELGGNWKLQDRETDSLTIAAFGIQAKLGENHAAWEWACKRLHENGDLE